MAIDRDRLPEFPLLTRQATNPNYLIQQILERANSFTHKISGRPDEDDAAGMQTINNNNNNNKLYLYHGQRGNMTVHIHTFAHA